MLLSFEQLRFVCSTGMIDLYIMLVPYLACLTRVTRACGARGTRVKQAKCGTLIAITAVRITMIAFLLLMMKRLTFDCLANEIRNSSFITISILLVFSLNTYSRQKRALLSLLRGACFFSLIHRFILNADEWIVSRGELIVQRSRRLWCGCAFEMSAQQFQADESRHQRQQDLRDWDQVYRSRFTRKRCFVGAKGDSMRRFVYVLFI